MPNTRARKALIVREASVPEIASEIADAIHRLADVGELIADYDAEGWLFEFRLFGIVFHIGFGR